MFNLVELFCLKYIEGIWKGKYFDTVLSSLQIVIILEVNDLAYSWVVFLDRYIRGLGTDIYGIFQVR